MYEILGGQVRHPPELLKSYQVLKFGFNEILHFDGADIFNLMLCE